MSVVVVSQVPTLYYYMTHSEYQRLQRGIAILKGRAHQKILPTTGKGEESAFIKHALWTYINDLETAYKEELKAL